MDLSCLPPAFTKAYDTGRTISQSPRSTIHEGVQIATRRTVAIKFFDSSEGLASAEAVCERLAPLIGLRHPNVVSVMAVGVAGTAAYLAMEYLEGGSLESRLATGPLPVPQAADVALDCLKGLAAARRRSLAPAELSTASVLLAAGGQAKLIGLARSDGDAGAAGEAADATAVARLLLEMLGGASHGAEHGAESTGVSGTLVRAVEVFLAMAVARPATSGELSDLLRPHASRRVGLVEPLPVTAPVGPPAPLLVTEPRTALPLVVGSGDFDPGATQVICERGAFARLVGEWGAAARPPSRPSLLMRLIPLILVLGLGAGPLWRLTRPTPQVVEQARDVDSARAEISWKTSTACFSRIEYWPATSTRNKLRTALPPIMQVEHRHALPDLKPDTTYDFRFLFYHSADEEDDAGASEVFDFTTRPEIQIFNMHVDEYATKAVVTWETNLRTDTAVKYGNTDQYEDLRANPEQKSETIHSITVEQLNPDTTYHYRILASDPRGRSRTKPSEDLQFRTCKEDAGPDPAGAGCYYYPDGIWRQTRMTPDERETLKNALRPYLSLSVAPLSDEKARMLGTSTRPDQHGDFCDRLHVARRWITSLMVHGRSMADGARYADLLQTLYYINKIQASQRLDALFRRLEEADRDQSKIQDLEKTLEASPELDTRTPGPIQDPRRKGQPADPELDDLGL